MKLTSPEFEQEGKIPEIYTCDGKDINPELHISEIPGSAKSLALIVDDPDAPSGTFVHWVMFNIPPGEKIAENSAPGKQGSNNFGKTAYGGPCPPSGTHRYYFKLYALDTELDLAEGSSKQELLDAMEGHIVEEAELMGTYARG